MEPNVTTTQTSTDNPCPLFGTAMDLSRLPFRNPFVGLRPFETNESLLFFGRSEQTVDLLQQLHRGRLLAVVGSSGCGKSSLIRAGLIPKLKAGFLVEDRDLWLTVAIKPGADPLGNLAEALLQIPAKQTANNKTTDEFASRIRSGGTQAILEHVNSALSESDTNLLLLVDQFEEVFSARDEAADFISILLALAEQTALPVYVVLTMRSDFWDRCEEFYGLPEAMNRSLYMVPRLTRQQRQQAIEGPIRLFSASLTARLLDRVLNDAGDQSDQLPVMQHALMRTWDEWRKPSAEHHPKHSAEAIDVCCYEAVGTIKEALSRDAEAALKGMMAEELKVTEQMFQALTDTDVNNRRIRRRVHLNEIAAIAQTDTNKVRAIIKRFTDNDRSFLIARPRLNAENPQIDISHESLIRQWKQLSEWIDTENSSNEIYKRLTDAAKRHRIGRGEHWRGADLRDALEWFHHANPNEEWSRRYSEKMDDFDLAIEFLLESRNVEKLTLAHEEQRRKGELRRTRTFAAVICVAFLLALLATWIVRRQQKEAQKQEEAATHLFYAANMNLAQEACVNEKHGRAYDLLTPFLPSPESKYLARVREFYWYHLWRSIQQATLKGHESGVWSVAISPDGKTLASASDDRTIKLWDVVSRKNTATLKGHENFVRSIIFSPDGKTLASASNDQTVKLWNVASRQNTATLKGHEDSVWSVAFSPDGKTLASASDDRVVKLWDVVSWQNTATLIGHESYVWSVAFSPDSKTLASASDDGTVKLWDVASRQNTATLKGHEDSVLSVAFSPDAKTLATVSNDRAVKLWDVASRQNTTTLKGHQDSVLSVAFSPDGKMLASASDDQTVKLWDVASRQNTATLKGHEDSVRSVAFFPDGKTLASACDDRTIKLWDVVSRQHIAILNGHEYSVWSVAFSPDGKTLASASHDRTVKLWDVASRQYIATLKGHEAYIWSVAFSPDGKTLASASDDGTVKLWDVASRQNTVTLKGHEAFVRSIAFSPDGKTLASASDDQTVKLWDVASRQNIATLKGHEFYVLSVAFSPDGKTLASASADQVVKLWDVVSRQNTATLKGHESAVPLVAFSPNGKTLASASADRMIKLWDVASRQNTATLNGHESAVWSVAFSPDGKTLASASEDKTIKLWDAVSLQNIATLKGHESAVWSIAFAPDNKTLASAGGDRIGKKDFAIRLWFAATDEEVARQRNK